jgi:hypothetical protein
VIKEVSVKLHRTKEAGNNIGAIADLELQLASNQGSIGITGFRVMVPDGKAPWVSPPARQGKTRWFDSVTFKGPVKKLVDTAILQEFDHQRQKAASPK